MNAQLPEVGCLSAADLIEKYTDLRDEFSALTSALAVLKRAIRDEDSSIVGEVTAIFESHAGSVLDRHPKLGGEVRP